MVELAIADLNSDERVAFARVVFTREVTVSWKMAVTTPIQDVATLGPNEYFGYGVDAGTGVGNSRPGRSPRTSAGSR